MEVVPVSTLRAASLLWQPRRGNFSLTVVAKGTFQLAPGECTLAREQEHPNESDNHWNDDVARSIYSPTDLVPFKRRVDVLLVGNAFAPPGQPARSVIARLQVGEVDKSIEVFCDRSFAQDGSLREGSRFQRMALRWERAAGGPDSMNPVGIRGDVRDAYGAATVPNLQAPGLHVASPDQRFDPVGFGPIAPAWPLRAAKLGRYAATWSSFDWNRQALPQEVDPSFFNAAPLDQQLDALHDDERFLLEHLHPQHPMLVTRLPGLRPRAIAVGARGTSDVDLVADTLWIDTDRGLCTVTWRGQIPLDNPLQQGRVFVAMEGRGERLSAADVARLAGAVAPPSRRSEEGTRVVGGEVDTMAIKPRAPATLADPSRASSDAWGLPFAAKSAEGDARPRSQIGGLPFAQKLPPGPPPAPPPPSWKAEESDRTATELPHGAEVYAAALPPPAPPPIAAPPPPPLAPSIPSSPASPWASSGAASGSYRDDAQPGTVGSLAVQAPPLAVPSAQIDTSAAGISNAAAGQGAFAPPPAPVAAAAPQPAARPARGAREVIDLLWFDPACVPALEETERFREILADLAPKEEAPSFDDDDPFELKRKEPDEPPEKKDRKKVFAVVARAYPTDGEELPQVLGEAVDDEGRFVPPLVVVAGELVLPFDEIATLKATIAAVSPLIGGDLKLKGTVDTVNELLQADWASGAGVAEGLTAKVKDAFAQSNRVLPANYLEQHTERTLLEQRQFQKRTVFGEPRLRGQFQGAGSAPAIPVYLPEALTNQLPMFQRFRVRVLCEVHLQQDQFESHPMALKAVALGRVSTFGRRI